MVCMICEWELVSCSRAVSQPPRPRIAQLPAVPNLLYSTWMPIPSLGPEQPATVTTFQNSSIPLISWSWVSMPMCSHELYAIVVDVVSGGSFATIKHLHAAIYY